ncbi:hypothetical protein M885DRAFT_617662 [Pelagophyceae sp. CCMP2097]|nr:hypothetical protein M885DRAFT_617662 [Pelagophyceae sp. CCMP2097]
MHFIIFAALLVGSAAQTPSDFCTLFGSSENTLVQCTCADEGSNAGKVACKADIPNKSLLGYEIYAAKTYPFDVCFDLCDAPVSIYFNVDGVQTTFQGTDTRRIAVPSLGFVQKIQFDDVEYSFSLGLFVDTTYSIGQKASLEANFKVVFDIKDVNKLPQSLQTAFSRYFGIDGIDGIDGFEYSIFIWSQDVNVPTGCGPSDGGACRPKSSISGASGLVPHRNLAAAAAMPFLLIGATLL